jgi:adenylyltransferase/sulfurtransferase
LAAAGVGRIGVVDFDAVDRSNLHRQVLYGENDLGNPKVDAARDRLLDLNPDIEIQVHSEAIGASNAMATLANYDVIVDGTDNFPTRYLINDCCVFLGKPNVYGSIFRFDGQVSVFCAPRGPCYRCLYPAPPPPGEVPSCAEAGVLGVLPGIIGALQTAEALKLILGLGDSLAGELLLVDTLSMEMRKFAIKRDSACPVCGDAPTITSPIDYEAFCGVRIGEPEGAGIPQASVQELRARKTANGTFILLDVRDADELAISRIDPCLHIPMSQVPSRIGTLDPDAEYWVMCKTGSRGNQIAGILIDRGFSNVRNVSGGINAWAHEIDPDVLAY